MTLQVSRNIWNDEKKNLLLKNEIRFAVIKVIIENEFREAVATADVLIVDVAIPANIFHLAFFVSVSSVYIYFVFFFFAVFSLLLWFFSSLSFFFVFVFRFLFVVLFLFYYNFFLVQ